MLLIVGCSQPLEGVDLPPASLPDDIGATQWAIAFAHDFGPGFWEEGPHAYQLTLDCPEAGEVEAESRVIPFAAGPDFPTFDDPVRLRIAGLSTTDMGGSDVTLVSTDQHTIALITAVGLSEDQVNAAARCTGQVFWDDGKSASMEPRTPFRP